MNVLNQPVLTLNANWQALAPKTVKDAIVAMMGGLDGNNPPAYGIDCEFAVDEECVIDWNNMIYANPVSWDEWVKLPIRDSQNDEAVHSSNMTIRAPRHIIQPNYSKMPIVRHRPTKDAIARRDNLICQYTGKKLSRGQGNIDHIIPRDKGGKNTFENMVWCDKDINSKKANRTPEEAGLVLLRKPKAPAPLPLSALIKEAKHPSCIPFIFNHKN
jgi:5-methylcytosine-specific restriction endonuclease McrA